MITKFNPFMEPLNEVYFGENEQVQKFIQLIHDFRTPYLSKKSYNYIFPGSNSNPKLMAISEHLEDWFGFGAVDFNIINAPYMNAMTFPVCYKYDCKPEDHIKATKDGFRFDKEFNYVTQIVYTSNIILNPAFTDREVAAILLHEVGHSFVVVQKEMVPLVQSVRDSYVAQCIYLAILAIISMNPYLAIQSVQALFQQNNTWQLFRTKVSQFYKKTPIGKLNDVIGSSVAVISMFSNKAWNAFMKLSGLSSIGKFIDVAFSGWKGLSKNQKEKAIKKNHEDNALGRSMEYFSDNLPTSYGLGMDLSSALGKMEFGDFSTNGDKLIEDLAKINPLNKALGEATKIPYYEMINHLDVHPMYAERVKKIEMDLKAELAKSKINPKMKKEIEESLKEIKKLKLDNSKVANIKDSDPNAYKRLWMAAYFDDRSFLNKDEKDMTSMKDRDMLFDKLVKEYSYLFDNYDKYEFVD